jgi:hypothetical protein
MKNSLNLVKNDRIIRLTPNCDFFFLEEDVKIPSPVSRYYFKFDDLSINLNIKLKWVLYGYFFLKGIDDGIDDFVGEDDLLFSASIDPFFKVSKNSRILFLDDFIVGSILDFSRELEVEYARILYTENSNIHLKLKVNFVEYAALQNIAFPRIGFIQDVKTYPIK